MAFVANFPLWKTASFFSLQEFFASKFQTVLVLDWDDTSHGTNGIGQERPGRDKFCLRKQISRQGWNVCWWFYFQDSQDLLEFWDVVTCNTVSLCWQFFTLTRFVKSSTSLVVFYCNDFIPNTLSRQLGLILFGNHDRPLKISMIT